MAVLTQPWPPDLHPSRVPFRKRTATMLQRAGLWDDMTQIDQPCICDIAAPVDVSCSVQLSSEDRGPAMQWLSPEQTRRAMELIPRYQELEQEFQDAFINDDLDRVKEIADEMRPVVAELGEIFGLPTALNDTD